MSLADLMKKGSLRPPATVTVAAVATANADSLPSVASAATVSVAMPVKQEPEQAQDEAANNPAAITQDPDRWCWPHSSAMTGGEIDTFTVRLYRFTERGLLEPEAERMADSLVIRDREGDDRRSCLECAHLAGQSMGLMCCGNGQRAGLAVRAGDAQLSTALVMQLQRCDGFEDASAVIQTVTG